MYYALNIYYVVFSIFSSPVLLQYWPDLRGALFQYRGMHFFVCVVAFIMLSYILEAPLCSFTPRNGSHFCSCFFRFSLKFIAVAKSSAMEGMPKIVQLCSPVW